VAELTPAQTQAVQTLLDAVRPIGGGKGGIEVEALTSFARDEPELTAGAVRGLLLVSGESKGYGNLAVALAAAYDSVFDDDSLSVVVREHYAALGEPVPAPRVQVDEEAPAPAPPIHYDVPPGALSGCDIYPLLKMFSHRHLAADDPASRLASLGGRLYLTFPVPVSDPRHVWQVPEVRAYVRAVADAMPYFPYYLAPDPRLGMFEVYFGSLVDPSMLAEGTFDLMSEENFLEVGPALLNTMRFADALSADGEASVRALLSAFSAEAVDLMMEMLGEIEQQLEQEPPD
jgi:hypothetical protein